MRAELRREVEGALASRVESVRAVSGGDINEAWRLDLSDGRSVFMKTHPSAHPQMYPAEAHGLGVLRESGALVTPQVLAVSPEFLVLEYLEPGRPRAGFDQRLGRGLAELHRSGLPCFGLERDNFIGSLPQGNAESDDWETFFRERRLAPMVKRAVERKSLPLEVARNFDRLYQRLGDLLGPEEPPSRLHGDLWGGNLHVTPDGAPCLIDPAVYGGSREIDLAMMELFGGFSSEVFAAYREAWPFAPGYEERLVLYQLYPLLVHVNSFGSSYVGGVKRALERLC